MKFTGPTENGQSKIKHNLVFRQKLRINIENGKKGEYKIRSLHKKDLQKATRSNYSGANKNNIQIQFNHDLTLR